jgi:hypothetical protein
VFGHPEGRGDPDRGIEFNPVALAVTEGQGVGGEASGLGLSQSGGRIHPTGEQDDGML